MKILAEYNGERVYLINIRENGTCDIIKTTYNEKTDTDTGELLLVYKKDLKIVDGDYLIDSLQEHLRQLEKRNSEKKNAEQTTHEEAVKKSVSDAVAYVNTLPKKPPIKK